jgi:hypothetical protein
VAIGESQRSSKKTAPHRTSAGRSMTPAANVVAEPDSVGQIDVFRPGDFDAHPSSLLQPHGAAPVPVVS